MKRNAVKYLLLFISVIAFAAAQLLWDTSVRTAGDFSRAAVHASGQLTKLEQSSEKCISQTIGQISSGGLAALEKPGCTSEWFSIFIYQNDSLVWWSDNQVAPSIEDVAPGFRFYRNGWYEFINRKSGNFTIAGLLKIKNEYSFQNRFLVNGFHPSLNFPSGTKVHASGVKDSFAVSGNNSSPLFYISHDPAEAGYPDATVPSILYTIGFILFGLFLYWAVAGRLTFNLKAAGVLMLFVIMLRLIALYTQWPEALFSLPLFSPSYYASSFLLNSLGELLITSLILAGGVIILYRVPLTKRAVPFEKRSPAGKLLPVVIPVLVTLFYSVFINYLLASLIINSRISFNISNVFELDLYSLTGVVVIGILLYTFYKVSDGNTRIMMAFRPRMSFIVPVIAITSFLFFGLVITLSDVPFFADYGVRSFMLSLAVILFTGFFRIRFPLLPAFTRSMVVILVFSIFCAYAISDFNNIKEQENRKVLAAKLENEQDQVAEYLFDDIASAVANDKVIIRFFETPYEDVLALIEAGDMISDRMSRLYFTGYWGRYDISIKCFNNEGLPINTGGDPSWSMDFFNNRIRQSGSVTANEYLFFTGNNGGRISYTAMIPVYGSAVPKVQTGTIAISMVSKIQQGKAGFPELLLSDKVPQRRDISVYSFAHYREGSLVNQSGPYSYLNSSAGYKNRMKAGSPYQFLHFDDYCHLFYRTSTDGLLIISTRMPEIPGFVTFFSYLFSFYGICFILYYVFSELYKGRGYVFLNFKNRIQATVIFMVVITMLLIGSATVYYIFTNHQSNIGLTLNDRMRSMLIAIRDELSARSLTINEASDEMNYTFSKLSGTLDTDFSIFSPQGRLIYTTQPKIYDQGLIARTMNRNALNALVRDDKSLHIQYEEIGKLRYLSAYEPVRDNFNNIVGFINLPYFARQDELKRDISSFLVTLINIYVLLFASAIFITFIISGRITKPLQLIQQRLSRIKLGRRNELIEWNRDDEIGALVKEYNRMVEELAESADKLARSERESAWREMAKQVAHEIKNPLTPMKLSVQHLQRAWKEKHPDIDNIMQRFSQTLIEQIDTLSNIATEFSNFAKMPKANREVIDLASVLKNSVDLFSGNEQVTFTYYEHPGKSYQVFADREQMIRVFSNLLKNAVQAIPEGRQGHIHAEINSEGKMVVVLIRDNGSGIPEDQQARIFTPNFTTKNAGMGLGLSMVKNIVEQCGGTIRFVSVPGEGTSFYVTLPVQESPAEQNL